MLSLNRRRDQSICMRRRYDMVLSEEEKNEDKAEALPWWCDISHSRRHQSLWLQATLSGTYS